MISVERVTKRFGKVRALDDLSLKIEPGEAVALWGINGAGKTTVIRCVLGVIRFTGRVTVGGHDVLRNGKAARNLIGYVPQELAFHEDMRVGTAVRFCAALRQVDIRRCGEMLERVGLQQEGRKRVRELSGGMKQRLALAIALLADPQIIILDEPTSNLDAAARRDGMKMLGELRKAGKTILFASHRADEIAELAERVIVLDAGRLLRECPASEFSPNADGTQLIKLRLPAEQIVGAVDVLRGAGMDAHPNGAGLFVRTPSLDKAKPIHVLSRAQIEVRDFDLLSNDDAGGVL